MAIDKSGTWVLGDSKDDLNEYMPDFAESYGTPIDRVVHASCAACGADQFTVRLDDNEGCAERACVACNTVHAMFDTSDYVNDAEFEDAECPCGGATFEVAGGFAIREDGDVRWVFVGLRCISDGVLGVYADWKVDYSPTSHLLASV